MLRFLRGSGLHETVQPNLSLPRWLGSDREDATTEGAEGFAARAANPAEPVGPEQHRRFVREECPVVTTTYSRSRVVACQASIESKTVIHMGAAASFFDGWGLRLLEDTPLKTQCW